MREKELSKERLLQLPKTLVIGPGLVGSRFVELYQDEFEIKSEGYFETKLDIANLKALERLIRREKPEVIVNFAAATDVDEIEKERGKEEGFAWRTNVVGSQNLARICLKKDIFLIHLSTDFVFSGLVNEPGPYPEDTLLAELPKHLSWYGWTKLQGEKEIIKSRAKAAIVRIAYPYRADYQGKGDFARRILEAYDRKKFYPVFTDQLITPTFIDDLSFVLSILTKEKRPGIFHVASRDITSPYAFACYLLEKARGVKNPEAIVPKGSIVQFYQENLNRAKRPQFGGLRVVMTEYVLKVKFSTWREGIDKLARQLTVLEASWDAAS